MKAVMYGAGNIGRGFIGEMMCLSGYHVSFVDVNMEVINVLNDEGKYIVEVMTNEKNEEIVIDNIDGINGMDADAVAAAIAECDLMATAVGVNILPRIVGNIAKGLSLRFKNGNLNPFNIIICENLIDADKLLRKLIGELLTGDDKKHFDELVGLVEASIGRMVPIQNDPRRVRVEPFDNLIVDRDAFRGQIPAIKNMTAFSPFRLYIERKLYIHNMGHSMTAYLGNLKGYEFIWQAIEDEDIQQKVKSAMLSVAKALSVNYGVSYEELSEHVHDLIFRFKNRKLGDTVFRVGRDLKRKLSPEDRLIGAVKACIKAGVSPEPLYVGIAAAFKFSPDETSKLPYDEILKDISGLSPEDEIYKGIVAHI